MNITVSARSIRRLFLVAWTLVVFAGAISVFLEYVLKSENVYLIGLFGVAFEHNIPTWYISCLLALSGMLTALIAFWSQRQGQPFARHWWILAIGLLYISCDEAATIHEHCFNWIDSSGFFYYSWVIPGSIVVAVVALTFLPFLAHLPKQIRFRFIVAGSIYVGGALLLDMVCGYLHEKSGTATILYGLVDLTEESLEFLGITLFTLTLLDYITDGDQALRLVIQGASAGADPTGRSDGSTNNVEIARTDTSLSLRESRALRPGEGPPRPLPRPTLPQAGG